MAKIIGNTTATPNPRPDWGQTDENKADFIKNKPELGSLALKDQVTKDDLATDIQESLDKGKAAYDHSQLVGNPHGLKYDDLLDKPSVPSIDGLATEAYVDGKFDELGPLATKSVVEQTDLDSSIQDSLKKADNALQSYEESDPTVPEWAKAETKPSYTPGEIGALPIGARLSDLADDTDHRTVTEAEKSSWNGKLDKTGGTISGDLSVSGELTVAGKTMSDIIDDIDSKVDAEAGKGLSSNDFTNTYKTKVDNALSTDGGAISGDLIIGGELTVSGATMSAMIEAIDGKVDQEDGKALSTNDFTDEYKSMVEGAFPASGGTVSGSVSIMGDLTVKGVTTSETHETIAVEDNMIVLNSNKTDLQTSLSGTAINKNGSSTYGAVYDPSDDTFKFGVGTLNEDNEFTFSEGEGLPFAVRNDSSMFTDGNIVMWSADGNKLVDSGIQAGVQPDWHQADDTKIDYIKNKPDVDAMVRYTNLRPMRTDLGGVYAHNHVQGFNNVLVNDIITELLYPSIPASLDLVEFDMYGGKDHYYQKGYPITVNFATVLVYKGSNAIDRVVLSYGNDKDCEYVEIGSSAEEISVDGTYITFNFNANMNGTDTYRFRIDVIETGGAISTSDEFVCQFVNPVFYGTLDEGTLIDEYLPSSLARKLMVDGDFNHTYTTDNKCPVIAYPSERGKLKFILDSNGMNQKWDCIDMSLLINSQYESYYVYVGSPSTATETYKFIYQ